MYILSQGQFKWYIDESLNKGGNLGQANMIKFFFFFFFKFIYLFIFKDIYFFKKKKEWYIDVEQHMGFRFYHFLSFI